MSTQTKSDETDPCPRCGKPVEGEAHTDLFEDRWHPRCWDDTAQEAAEMAFERSLNPDNGPSDAGYRDDLRNAGRGHLLS